MLSLVSLCSVSTAFRVQEQIVELGFPRDVAEAVVTQCPYPSGAAPTTKCGAAPTRVCRFRPKDSCGLMCELRGLAFCVAGAAYRGSRVLEGNHTSVYPLNTTCPSRSLTGCYFQPLGECLLSPPGKERQRAAHFLRHLWRPSRLLQQAIATMAATLDLTARTYLGLHVRTRMYYSLRTDSVAQQLLLRKQGNFAGYLNTTRALCRALAIRTVFLLTDNPNWRGGFETELAKAGITVKQMPHHAFMDAKRGRIAGRGIDHYLKAHPEKNKKDEGLQFLTAAGLLARSHTTLSSGGSELTNVLQAVMGHPTSPSCCLVMPLQRAREVSGV